MVELNGKMTFRLEPDGLQRDWKICDSPGEKPVDVVSGTAPGSPCAAVGAVRAETAAGAPPTSAVFASLPPLPRKPKTRAVFVPSPPTRVSHVIAPSAAVTNGSRRRSEVTNREAALRAITAALGMGALLIAVFHAIDLPATTGQPVPVIPVAQAVPRDGSPEEALLLHLASAYGRLVVPPAKAFVYETGVYGSLAQARTAQRSDEQSGVTSRIGGTGPYALLVGTYDGVRLNRTLQASLRRAEVPYYLQALDLGGCAPAWPSALRKFARPLEERFLDDMRIVGRLTGGQTNAALATYRRPIPANAKTFLRLHAAGPAVPFAAFDAEVTAALKHAAARQSFASDVTGAVAALSNL